VESVHQSFHQGC